jgi:hypothetical protein
MFKSDQGISMRLVAKLLTLATFLFLPQLAAPSNAVTLHYSGSKDSNLQINLYGYSPSGYFQVGRGTTTGGAGSLSLEIDTDTDMVTLSGLFTAPGNYSINCSDPLQTDQLKGMIGGAVAFSASKQLYNYSVDSQNGWFDLGGGPDSGTVWSNGLLGAGLGVRGTQSLNNIATQGLHSNPVLYGSFAAVFNNIAVEILIGAQLTYQGSWECGLPPRPGVGGGQAVPEPSTVASLVCGLLALTWRKRMTRRG